MRHTVILLPLTLSWLFIALACSQGGNPFSLPEAISPGSAGAIRPSQTHLWGYYDVFVDVRGKTATVVFNRQAMFTANVVNFINGKPTDLSVHINDTPVGGDYVDVDIDVTLTHPFPGLTQYNGYDVRGVFMGDGSANLSYNPALLYPMPGTDQYMLPDPDDGIGGPDGYTRWFNKAEFSTGGIPLLQYTQGKIATPGFNGTATLCPYRYFADYLGKDENLWSWLTDPDNNNPNGVFGAGQGNTRNYYLRFPNMKGVRFGYAVLADWAGTEPQFHPSNAAEAIALSVIDNSTVYYSSPSQKGGNVKLDIGVWDWDSQATGGVMQDYRIFLESTVLSNVYQFNTADMTGTGGGEHFSTYSVDIPADNIMGAEDNEYWVIVEQQGHDYKNDFGITNLCEDDPLAGFFRYDLHVENEPSNTPPVIDGITDDVFPDGLNPAVDQTNTAVTYSVDFTDPDPGQTHTISWYIEAASATGPTDPADLLPFNWAPKSVGDYKIWVRVNDGFATTTGGPYDISRVNISGWARTWGSGLDDEGWQLAVDNQGNAYVMGYFSSTIDFDPDPGQTDLKTAVGPYWRDYYLCKYDATGDYKWARTWGGPSTQTYGGVCVDDLGSVYAAGQFGYPNIDFDPDPATSDVHSPVGGSDIFLSKFDTDGNYKWVRCWGGTGDDWLNHAVADVSGNVFVTGWYGSVGADFDPGSGTAILSSNGGYDPWLSKFDSSGNLQWAKGWGGLGMDLGTGNAIDSSGNVYSVGTYAGTVDFDPGAGVDNHTANGGQDAYVLKLNSSGTFQWARTWGAGGSSNNYDQVQGASADNAGFVYVCGIFQGIDADFDPGSGVDNHSSNGAFDDFLSKFDSSGTFQWALTWGGSLDENAYSCAYDGVGNVYVTGHFMSANVDFDPGAGTDNHSSISSADWFLSKLDSSGTFQWARTWGNTTVPWGSDFGFDIACRYPGAVYVIGLFSGTIDLDPGSGADLHTSYGAQDACLMKVLSNGYWQ